MHSSTAAASTPSSDSSMLPGTTAASSITARACGPSASTRSATASRTLAGTPTPRGAASASVTKNGLPPETACRSAASWPARSASRATAPGESEAGSIRRTQLRGSAPRTRRTSGSTSLRLVRIRQPGERTSRRPSSATRSSVASSAQCRSSTTSTAESASSSSAAVSTPSREPEPSSAASIGPPTTRATSRSGPIGRGVISGSHAPQSTRLSSSAAVTDVTSAVLPIPASPITATTRPASRDSAIAPSSTSRSPSRSRSSNAAEPSRPR